MAQPRAAHIRPAVVDDLDRIMELVWEVAAEGRWIGAEVPFDRQLRRERYASLVEGAQLTVMVADASLTGGPGVIAAAISLYQRAGFTEEGRKPRHYRRRHGTLWDAVLMGLHLSEARP